jgi:Putative adhesin
MKIQHLLLWLFILRGGILTAQTTLQVVTKTVEKTLPCPKGSQLNIDAEKADMTLRTDNNSRDIKIKVELIARHPLLEVAKQDLGALKLLTETISHKVYIRNYVAIAKGAAKPSADLRTRYTITLPPDLIITLKNSFGKLDAADLTNEFHVTAEFCKIQLTNIKATTSLDLRFGDLEANKLDGKTAISSHRTDIVLSTLSGVCVIKAQFGKIKINADAALSSLTIVAEKTDVTFDPVNDAARFGYNLNAEYGTVTTPSKLNFKFIEKSNQREKVQLLGKAAYVNIYTTFGQIVINQ